MATRRKTPKGKRKPSKKGKVSPAKPAPGVFRRAPSFPKAFPPPTKTVSVKSPLENWRRQLGTDIDHERLDEGSAESSLAELQRLADNGDIPQHVVDALAEMDPSGSYRVIFIVEDYESTGDDVKSEAPPDYGSGSRRRIDMIGVGYALLAFAIRLTDRCTIVDIDGPWEVPAINRDFHPDGSPPREIFPYYADDTSLSQIGGPGSGMGPGRGHGIRRPRGRKRGPKPKSTGRLTRVQWRRIQDADRKAIVRDQKTRERIQKLRKSKRKADHRKADQLERRQRAGRRGAERAQQKKKQNKAVFARVHSPKRKQAKKSNVKRKPIKHKSYSKPKKRK